MPTEEERHAIHARLARCSTSGRPEECEFTALCVACDFWASVRAQPDVDEKQLPCLACGRHTLIIARSRPTNWGAIASRDAELLRSRAAGSQTKRTPLSGNSIADAAERIVELLELVADAKRAADAATEPQERRRKRNKVRALLEECNALRDRLADEFGSRFGWVRARTGFTLQDLGRKPTYRYDTEVFDDDVVDHPTFFREPNRPYPPAAIAAHNHGPWLSDPADLAPLHYAAKLKDYASTFDLEATIVTDFPSWYWPGETMLVLYRPLPTIRSTRREEHVAEALEISGYEKHEPAEADA